VIVVDAGVIAAALGSDDPQAVATRSRVLEDDLVAPYLIDVEVVSTWRKLTAAGRLDGRRAEIARIDLRELPIRRVPHTRMMERCWELRHNVTIYDAVYVALAEALDVPLVTADRRLANATGPRCRFEVLTGA